MHKPPAIEYSPAAQLVHEDEPAEELLPATQLVRWDEPAEDFVPAAHKFTVSAAAPVLPAAVVARAVPPAMYEPAAACATVTALAATPALDVILYPGLVTHAVLVVVVAEPREVIPAALPESLNVAVHAVTNGA